MALDAPSIEIDVFAQWFLSNPQASVSPKISFSDLSTLGLRRGIVAKEDIEEGTELFTIPRSSILSVENSNLLQKIPEAFEELDIWSSLILVMIYEFVRGENSPWKQYFEVFPRHFNSLMFWSETELAELQGSAVSQKIGKEQADEMFKSRLLPVIQSHPELFRPTGPNGGDVFAPKLSEDEIFALAHRMGSTIMAYAFDLEKDEEEQQEDEDGFLSDEEDDVPPKGMIPMADMLNADPQEYNAQLFYGKDALTMKAIKAVNKGMEIFIDNGPLPQSDLLRRYGYVADSHAKYDVVEVPLDLVVDVASLQAGLSQEDREHRLHYLEENEMLDDGYDISYPSDDSTPFPPELLGLINGLLLPTARFQAMSARGSLPKDKMNSSVANVLISMLERRQRNYGTSIEEDQNLLSAHAARSRFTMAVEVRLGEKMVMESALRTLRDFSVTSEHSVPMTGEKRPVIGNDLATSKKPKSS